MSVTTDELEVVPEPAPRRSLLSRVHPLAKLAAPMPAILYLFFTRDVVTPGAFLLLALGLLLAAAGLRMRYAATMCALVVVFVPVLTVSFGVWTDPATVDDTALVARIGDFPVYAGALAVGLATALRLAALLLLAFAAAAATDGPALVRAGVRYLRVPYRFGFAALAAFRFVPRFRYELEVIRQAHRVRGAVAGRGPLAAARRGLGYVIPLLAGALRHAERMALAMDARAFGAHPSRTERHDAGLRGRDIAYTLVFWAVSAAIAVGALTL